MMRKLDQRGAAAMEFGLVIAPLFVLMFVIFDFGRYAITMQSLRNLASAAARQNMIVPPDYERGRDNSAHSQSAKSRSKKKGHRLKDEYEYHAERAAEGRPQPTDLSLLVRRPQSVSSSTPSPL